VGQWVADRFAAFEKRNDLPEEELHD
jgi:hypothetical protein